MTSKVLENVLNKDLFLTEVSKSVCKWTVHDFKTMCDVMPISLTHVYQCFGGTYRLHLQSLCGPRLSDLLTVINIPATINHILMKYFLPNWKVSVTSSWILSVRWHTVCLTCAQSDVLLLQKQFCRRQWHEVSSPTRTLWSWVRIPLEIWTHIKMHFLCLCVALCR
jgi:hypothetical protein